jgi:hypothetical protein
MWGTGSQPGASLVHPVEGAILRRAAKIPIEVHVDFAVIGAGVPGFP